VLVVVALAALASGCGGSSAPSRASYGKEVDRVCATLDDRVSALQKKAPQTTDEIVAFADDLQKVLDDGVRQLSEVDRPDGADGAPVGTTGLMTIDWRQSRATFGISIGERRGTGLGTDATRLTLDWAFNMLGLHNVMLTVLPTNTAAIRAYEKAGFRRIGVRRDSLSVLGHRGDEVLMDAVASEFDSPVLAARR